MNTVTIFASVILKPGAISEQFVGILFLAYITRGMYLAVHTSFFDRPRQADALDVDFFETCFMGGWLRGAIFALSKIF